MEKVLRADLFYYKKYIAYLLIGTLIPIIINTIFLYGIKVLFSALDEESKLTYLFALNIQSLLAIVFFLFCVFGSLKQCRFLQHQIIGTGNRHIVYNCKFLEIASIGSLMYLSSMVIYISSAVILVHLQINLKILFIVIYQYLGFVRFLLWSFFFFILCNKIYVAFLCVIMKTIIEVSLCLLLFSESKQTVFDSILATILIYLPFVSFTYNPSIFIMVDPLVLMIVTVVDISIVWLLGDMIFKRKALR